MPDTQKGVELAVVIPAYNEAAAIARVLSGWMAQLDRLAVAYQIHVYDDGSTDGTAEILDAMALNHPRILVHHKANSGHGPTILLGYRQNSGMEWLLQVDADDEMRPEHFAQLWQARADYDLLLGSREGRQGPWLRRLMTWVCRRVVRFLYGGGIGDVNSPYRLMRTNLFKTYFELIPQGTFAPNVLLSGIACLKKARIREVAVPYVPKPAEEAMRKKWKPLNAAMRSFVETVCFRFTL